MHTIEATIDNDTYALLKELRAQLAAYKTVQCGLMHEQVQTILDDSTMHDGDLSQLVVQRKGFCDRHERRKWLGCSHTIANDNFAMLADKVYDAGIPITDARPSALIKDIVLKVYLMDHEKSRMEKQKAVAAHLQQEEKFDIASQELRNIVARHRVLISELEEIRSSIMHRIDEVLANY